MGRMALLIAWLLMSGLVLAATAGCQNDDETETTIVEAGDLQITGAFARAVMDGGAAYLTVRNTGDEDDALVAASSDVAEMVGLHETVTEGAMMKMQAVEEIAVPAGGEAILEPGGYHVMLMQLKGPLEEGDTFDMTLTFAEAGTVDVAVAVKPFVVSDERVDDPYNPSYRVVTSQVLSIESALGTRGGLSVLLRGAEPSWQPAAMRVMTIEQAWPEVRLELERRAERQDGVEGVIDTFESALAGLRADIAAEDGRKALGSLSELTAAFDDVKGVLHKTEVDWRRLTAVVSGLALALIVLAVGSRLIGSRRDRKFMPPRRTGDPR